MYNNFELIKTRYDLEGRNVLSTTQASAVVLQRKKDSILFHMCINCKYIKIHTILSCFGGNVCNINNYYIKDMRVRKKGIKMDKNEVEINFFFSRKISVCVCKFILLTSETFFPASILKRQQLR